MRKLNADIAAIMRQPEVANPLLAQGAEPQSGPPEELRKLLDARNRAVEQGDQGGRTSRPSSGGPNLC